MSTFDDAHMAKLCRPERLAFNYAMVDCVWWGLIGTAAIGVGVWVKLIRDESKQQTRG